MPIGRLEDAPEAGRRPKDAATAWAKRGISMPRDSIGKTIALRKDIANGLAYAQEMRGAVILEPKEATMWRRNNISNQDLTKILKRG